MRYITGLVILIAASMGCSHPPNKTAAASPTSPTAGNGTSTINFIGGVSGPMDVLFPGRNESLQFRNDLETKYQTGLGRSATASTVDKEGEVVWTQEYIRYRVNGCDHATSVQRVMTQIDGGVAGGICSAPPEGLVIFPSRADSLQFRRDLETKYQQMGRGLGPTFVDMEGGVIWTQEYLRYRANACDHPTGEAKVFSQIDGGPVPDVCLTPCSLSVNPNFINIDSGPASGSFEVRPGRADCNIGFTAVSDASWLTIPSENATGTGFTTIPYSIARNGGGSRVGHIRISFSGGSAAFEVNQPGSQFTAGVVFTDPFRSGATPTTECHVRSTSTPCVLTASPNLSGNSYVYEWNATYFYGTQKTLTQTGSSNVFTITDGCGGTGSTAEGAGTDFTVTLTVTDSQGNTVTFRSDGFALRLFTC